MSALWKNIQFGGFLLAFFASVLFPPQLVLTATQLILLVVSAALAYHLFGDALVAFINRLMEDKHGTAKTPDTREPGSQERAVEPTVAAADAATEGERNPA